MAPSFTHSTQGRLLCTQRSQHEGWVAPHCRFSICFVHRSLPTRGVRLCTRAGLHESRVGTSMPLEGALNPQVWYLATPPSSTHPKLGVRSKHQRLHSCALKGIFRPLLQGGRSDLDTAPSFSDLLFSPTLFMFSIEIYKLNRNGTERTSGKAGVGDEGRVPRPAERLLVVRWAGRCGERTERCQWQRKRSERVAAVKILSVRRKAAKKFWAPQQDHRPLRRFDKKAPAWNPPVTALPCQGPLGKGAFGDWGCGLPQPACALVSQ